MPRAPRNQKNPKPRPTEAVVETPVVEAATAAERSRRDNGAAVAEPAIAEPAPELQPPSTPVEPVMDDAKDTKPRNGAVISATKSPRR